MKENCVPGYTSMCFVSGNIDSVITRYTRILHQNVKIRDGYPSSLPGYKYNSSLVGIYKVPFYFRKVVHISNIHNIYHRAVLKSARDPLTLKQCSIPKSKSPTPPSLLNSPSYTPSLHTRSFYNLFNLTGLGSPT